jgi:hypothetical protein
MDPFLGFSTRVHLGVITQIGQIKNNLLTYLLCLKIEDTKTKATTMLVRIFFTRK